MNGPKKAEALRNYGHAGGHLRDALLNALDYQGDWWKHVEVDFIHERHERWWKRLLPKRRALWLLGQLWSCSDILPSLYVTEITDRDPDGRHQFRTFAVLARLLAQDLKHDRAAA